MRVLCVALLLFFGTFLSAQTLVLKTSKGDIVVELYPDVAPKAVENFITLAEQSYYDGTIFHRVIERFMIQGGDPDGTGRGGESMWGEAFADEFKPYVTFDRVGILAMANSGPNTNKSQFFITTIPTPWLSGRHTIFGEVIEGMDVVRAIEKTPVGAMDKPIEPQVILSIRKEQ